MKHPNKKNQEYQEKFLSKLSANEREEHARMFRFGNASYIYHQRSKEFKPTQSDFQEWLAGLPENIGNDMKKKDLKLAKIYFLSADMLWRKMMSEWMSL